MRPQDESLSAPANVKTSELPKGIVYLVAAGPGDPGLLTLRAAELLSRCDCVLFDALANPILLRHACETAELISVGKHGGDRIWSKNEIDAEILRHALAGKRVVRLKGGDTSIFARTAEEIEFLIAHNIPFEVVPGVTSASAASAYAGIPLTHRDWSSAVALVTGHQQSTDGADEAEDELDWNALAKFPGTLVLYMAVTNADRWSQRLIQAGKAASTPVAIVRNASLPNQKVYQTTLANLNWVLAGPPKLRPPILFIIGPVAAIDPAMNWYCDRPLSKISILLTRPAGTNEDLAFELQSLGATTYVSPAIELKPPASGTATAIALRASLSRCKDYDWILFSSAHGVHHWFEALLHSGRDARDLANCKFAGVGPSVAIALQHYHLNCDFFRTSDCNAEAMANDLQDLLEDKHVLNVSTNASANVLPKRLASVASTFETIVAYESYAVLALAPAVQLSLANVTDSVYVTVTSTAIAESILNLLQPYHDKIVWLALSPKIAEVLQQSGQSRIELLDDLSSTAVQNTILKRAQTTYS